MAGGTLNDVIVRLYDLVLQRPLATFKGDALALLVETIAFDSAIWASGVHRTNTIFSIATHNFGPVALMDYAANWQPHDRLRSSVVASPGQVLRNEDIMPVAEHRASVIYRRFCAPGGMHQTLGVATADPITTVGELVFLFRGGEDAEFSDEERTAFSTLAPHLFAAWRHRQLAGLLVAGGNDGALPMLTAYAVIDDDGLIHASDALFSADVARAFAGWNGPLLPDTLRAAAAGGRTTHLEAGQRFVIRRGTERHLVIAADRSDNALTAAERRTAQLYAEGKTHSAIASKLGLSGSTVRNQIAAAYQKLDVHSKVALARIFARDPS